MIRKSDIKWWILEAKEHPGSAHTIIEELAKRLTELDLENERLRNEILQLRRRTPTTSDSDEVSTLQRKITTLQRLLDGQASDKSSVVLLSDRLESARMGLAQIRQLAQENRPVPGIQAPMRLRHLLLVQPQGELLVLTNHGRGFKIQPSDIPFWGDRGKWAIPGGLELAEGERLTAAIAMTEPPRFWTIVTRRGFVRQFIRISFDRRIAQGDQVIESPFRNDEPVAIVNGDQGDLMLLTRWGKGVRFAQRAIAGQGSVALELDADDDVVAALTLPSDTEMLIVTAAGFAARRDTSRFAARSRPGSSGKTLLQAYDVMGVFPFESQARLLYLTYSGKLAFISMADVPLHESSRKGSRIRDFGRDPAVAVTLVETQDL